MTNKNCESNDCKNDQNCCSSDCKCCCTSSQLASFVRHIASYFDKKE